MVRAERIAFITFKRLTDGDEWKVAGHQPAYTYPVRCHP